jgi:hypothetical protein
VRFLKYKYVGVAEIGEILGVSHKRVDEIRKAKSLKFPEPIAILKCGPIWTRYKVERWADKWERKVGRPKKIAS